MKNILTKFYNEDSNILEIGLDEVGRGPMFGRVYTAGVILPKNDFKYELLKDSKKFTSEKKINEVANYIKEKAVIWSISYCDEKEIDELNIKNATYISMHKCIKDILRKLNENTNELYKKYNLLVDGNYFKPYIYLNENENILEQIPHITIEGGDNKYCSIAAASIIAKVERDKYIHSMCIQYPKLNIYNLEKNKGYGTLEHMNGIKKYGISCWHRKTFGICKESKINNEEYYI